MKQKFRIGTDDFKELIDDGGYFVDKSLFIRDIIIGNKVTLIPRPRRFGKTLNMTMLRYFFERAEESREYLFADCAIASFPEYLQHQGQYPVIYISLKDVKGNSWLESKARLEEKLADLFIRSKDLVSNLHPIYKKAYDAISLRNADDATLNPALKTSSNGSMNTIKNRLSS